MNQLQRYVLEVDSPTQAYSRIRKAIGYCGILIPSMCVGLSLFNECAGTLLPSISHYYYTIIGDAFVGVLFALGLFLVLYRSVFKVESLRRWENRWTNLAGVLAMIVAFIPTNPEGGSCYHIYLSDASYREAYGILGNLHLPAAGLMIVIFGIISYHFFPRDANTGELNSENKKIYRVCAWIIFISIGILVLYFMDSVFNGGRILSFLEKIKIVFVMECTSIGAFAFSWLKKGRAVGAIVEMYKEMTSKRTKATS